ncbi:hypothetical protein D3C81_1302620 [compost metagenome]
MQARGGDADFRTESQFAAIREPRRGVDHHHRRAQRVHEGFAVCGIAGGDHFGVIGGVLLDMRDGRADIRHHADRQDQIEILGSVVVFGSGQHIRQQRLRGRIAAQFHTAFAQCSGGKRQELRRDGFVHQQRLQRVAGRRARYLAVNQQIHRQRDIGAVIHEQMAHALVMLDHRHTRVLGDKTDQAFAAARNRQVDDVVELQQFQHGLAAQVFDQRQRRFRQAGVAQCALQACRNGGVGMDRLRAAAQDHAVTGLDAERCGIGGHVRPRFVDHRDHSQRYAHLLHADAIRPHVLARNLAHRVR